MFSFQEKCSTEESERKSWREEKIIEQVNNQEIDLEKLSNKELKEKTIFFRRQLLKAMLDTDLVGSAQTEKERQENYCQLNQVQEKVLENFLPEAFATVREASRRQTNKRHYDEQLAAGYHIHRGRMVKMRTGEGKTLAATTAGYLHALALNPAWVEAMAMKKKQEGTQIKNTNDWQFESVAQISVNRGVHVVTTNDYLARRDARSTALIYRSLGLKVGVLQGETATESRPAYMINETHDLEPVERKKAYQEADLTFGTNSQFGFDFLHDAKALTRKNQVQGDHYFAIFDEGDRTLIDEARTPLVLSLPGKIAERALYKKVDQAVEQLTESDYEVDERYQRVELTEAGEEKLSESLGLLLNNSMIPEYYDPQTVTVWSVIIPVLAAHFLYEKDRDYALLPADEDEQQVVIVDLGGRLLFGQTWSNGIHQAIQVKEGLPPASEQVIQDSIDIQSYANKYDRLAAMTGSPDGLEAELFEVYGMKTARVEAHFSLDDFIKLPEKIFATEEEKLKALFVEAVAASQENRPVLIGVLDDKKSFQLAEKLKDFYPEVQYQVLNSYSLQEEEEIVAKIGQPGMITIATNLAGRGTDPKLGGEGASPKDRQLVIEAGGLLVLGSEHNLLSRLDIQLAGPGRAGRQGEPGSSRIYLALTDRCFEFLAPYSSKLRNFLQELQEEFEKGRSIEDSLRKQALTFVDKAQQKKAVIEARQRKQGFEFNEVVNLQREALWQMRNKILDFSQAGLAEFLATKTQEQLEQLDSQQLLSFLVQLEQIQPTLEVAGQIIPAWSIKILFESVLREIGLSQEANLSQLSASEQTKFLKTCQELRSYLVGFKYKHLISLTRNLIEQLDFKDQLNCESFLETLTTLTAGKVNFSPGWVYLLRHLSKKGIFNLVERLINNHYQQDLATEDLLAESPLLNQVATQDINQQDLVAVATKILLGGESNLQQETRLSWSQLKMVSEYLEANQLPENQLVAQVSAHLSQVSKILQKISEQQVGAGRQDSQTATNSFLEQQRRLLLQIYDQAWSEHMVEIEALQQKIQLEGYAGRDVLTAYQQQADQLFDQFLAKIDARLVKQQFSQQLFSAAENSQNVVESIEQQLTPQGSLKPDVLSELYTQEIASLNLLQLVENYLHVIRAEKIRQARINLTTLFSQLQFARKDREFPKKLFTLLDNYIVVFLGNFIEHDLTQANNFDVAFASDFIWPEEMTGADDGTKRSITTQEKESYQQLMTRIMRFRAQQVRLQTLLNYARITEQSKVVDLFVGGIKLSQAELTDQINNLGTYITSLLDQLYGVAEKATAQSNQSNKVL